MAEVPARSLPAHDAWYGIVTKNEKPAPPRNWTSAFGPMVLPWRVEVRQVETRRDAGALKRRQQMRKAVAWITRRLSCAGVVRRHLSAGERDSLRYLASLSARSMSFLNAGNGCAPLKK